MVTITLPWWVALPFSVFFLLQALSATIELINLFNAGQLFQ